MSLERINRRGASAIKHFLSGKLISVALTLGYFFLLTRNLAVEDYADYVTAIAIAELAMGISTLGLDWLAAIKIPKVDPNRKQLQAALFRDLLCARIATQIFLFLIAAISIAFAACFFSGTSTVMLGICYALVEGLHRYVATALLDSALLQKTSKHMWIAKSLVQLLLCGAILIGEPSMLTAAAAIAVESIGSAIGLLIAVPALKIILQPVSIALNTALIRGSLGMISAEWPVVAPSYAGSLLSWVGSISTFVVIARVAGGDAVAAIVGFCATLTNQIRRYLPTEMFLGVIRSFVYARFASHESRPLFERDLHLFFGAGVATVVLCASLLSLFGEPFIALLANDKFPEALPLVLVAVSGLASTVGRRVSETAANAVSATNIWAASATTSLIAVPIAYILFSVTGQPVVLVLGWIAVDLISTTSLHCRLARQRAINAIPKSLVLRALALLPVLSLGHLVVQHTDSHLQYAAASIGFLAVIILLLERMGFVSLASARLILKTAHA